MATCSVEILTPEKLLSEFSLRQTQQRLAVLQVFLREGRALSHSDLEARLEGDIDRATIYRCLRQFMDAGILHRIPDEQFQTKYAVCSTCDHHTHHHDHVHFNCLSCSLTMCMEETEIPRVSLPEGFRPMERILIVQGYCRACSESESLVPDGQSHRGPD